MTLQSNKINLFTLEHAIPFNHVISLLQRLNSDEIDKLKAELELLKKKNGSLEKQLNELVDSNVQLRESNLILQGKCETLLEDLSIKEAKWSEKEDMLQAEVITVLVISVLLKFLMITLQLPVHACTCGVSDTGQIYMY